MGISIQRIEQVAKLLGLIAGIIGSLVIIISRTKGFKDWLKDRERRTESIHKLAENFESIDKAAKSMDEVNSKIDVIDLKINELHSNQIKSQNENIRQDEQIKDSLEERGILMRSNLAILDWMITQGANGTAHAARDEIRVYQTDRAHNFNKDGA